MSAPEYQRQLVDFHNSRAKALLQGVGSLHRDDLEYVVSRASTLKDERLKECIAELIKWGDSERAELETMIAIGIEAMRLCSPSRLREAARRVEMRYHLRGE
jgi:hypothetical protein